MSGPKVVRIITREEVIQNCQQRLNRVDIAISQWQNKRQRLGGDIQHDVALITQQRQQLQSLLQADEFEALQKSVPLLLESLAVNITDRQEQAINRQAMQLQQQRQIKENAAVILQQLEKNPRSTVPSQLLEQIRQIQRGTLTDEANQILQAGFEFIQQSQAITPVITDSQKDILSKMTPGHTMTTFDDWRKAQGGVNETPALKKLDRYISEINMIDPVLATSYLSRIAQLENESHQAQYQLLLDSLNIDLANDIRRCKHYQALTARLEGLLAEVKNQHITLPEAVELKIKQLNAVQIAEVESLITACQTSIDQHTSQITANYRRQAILNGLSKLGYEVREGMATVWQKDGKIIVNNPAIPGYGIEVGGQTASPRLQIRPVRLTPIEDRKRDLDVETLWCNDFDKLREWMANQGCEFELERSLAIGQAPVKYVSVTTQQVETVNKLENYKD